VGEPGEIVIVRVLAAPLPRVAKTMPAAAAAPPAMRPIFTHFEEYQCACLLRFVLESLAIRCTFVIVIVVSPIWFPYDAVTWT
jgi:hypothetical protein